MAIIRYLRRKNDEDLHRKGDDNDTEGSSMLN